MKFSDFSEKQRFVLTWWNADYPVYKNGIICDGAVRSGKSLCTSLSFILWAMKNFNFADFAICGKTINALRRNIINPLTPILSSMDFDVTNRDTYIVVSKGGIHNIFSLFGSRNESSASQIQGERFGGALFDEVALMPRTFVEQVLARCTSIEGERPKFWFISTPEHPYHWFYNEWIKRFDEKNMLYVHFTIDDAPSLSNETKLRYKSLYSGAFYKRFIEGEWVSADGLIYPMFDQVKHTRKGLQYALYESYFISCDYGTVNPCSMGLWGFNGMNKQPVACRIKEYYHNSRISGVQLTDEEYYTQLEKLANGHNIRAIIVDRSAASFIETIKRHGKFCLIKGDSDVLAGIDAVSKALMSNSIYIDESCADTLREFSLYSWNNAIRKDMPKKENDHAMDDIRYFVQAILNSTEATQ